VLDESSTVGVQEERAEEDRVDISRRVFLDEKEVGDPFNGGDECFRNLLLEVFSFEFRHLADCFFHSRRPGFCGLFNFCGERRKIISLHDAIGPSEFETKSSGSRNEGSVGQADAGLLLLSLSQFQRVECLRNGGG